MAVLDAANRQKVFAHLLRLLAWAGLIKPDVQAAVDATDDWIDANQAAYNAALPLPFRTTATLPQKTILFAMVALRRAGLLKTEGE
jgi:hypothetical protein